VEKKATQKKVRKVRPVDPDEDDHQVEQGEEAKVRRLPFPGTTFMMTTFQLSGLVGVRDVLVDR
jgi:hypothetical protein